jgi:hypothetical protein
MTQVIKSLLLICVLSLIFVFSGWLATYFLSYTGCVYTSSGVFSVAFLGMGFGIYSVINLITAFFH